MKRPLAAGLILALLLQALVGASVGRAEDKSIVAAVAQEPDRLYQSTTFAGRLVMNGIFDGLVEVDDQMRLYPKLAEHVPTLENGLVRLVGEGEEQALQVIFLLRRDVTWSDGQPFTSADVKATYELVMNPLSGFETSLESKIERVETPDPYTVVITYLSASAARELDPEAHADQHGPLFDPQYFFGVNVDQGVIYPAHVLEAIVGGDLRTSEDVVELSGSDFARNPVGTGPYQLESWEPGTELVLRARSDRSRGQVAIERVVFRFMPSREEAVAALKSGEVHVLSSDGLDVGDLVGLDFVPGIVTHHLPGTVWEQLTLNLDHPILADKAVRQALAHGIDRQELVDVVLFGHGEVAHSQVPSWSWAYNADVPAYAFDPRRAEALLDLAGWWVGPDGIRVKDGQRLSLAYWSTPTAFRPTLLPLIRDQLARIGVELNIEFVPAEVFFDAEASSDQALAARQFEVAQFAWVGGFDPGWGLHFINHSANIPSEANNYRGANYAGFHNFRNDLLLEQGLSVLDQQLRAWLYRDAQYILMEELPIIPLFLRPVTAAASDRVANFRPSMSSRGDTWNMEEWDLLPLAANTSTP